MRLGPSISSGTEPLFLSVEICCDHIAFGVLFRLDSCALLHFIVVCRRSISRAYIRTDGESVSADGERQIEPAVYEAGTSCRRRHGGIRGADHPRAQPSDRLYNRPVSAHAPRTGCIRADDAALSVRRSPRSLRGGSRLSGYTALCHISVFCRSCRCRRRAASAHGMCSDRLRREGSAVHHILLRRRHAAAVRRTVRANSDGRASGRQILPPCGFRRGAAGVYSRAP